METIDYDVFAYCNSLTSITIPDSVTSIGLGAFADCVSLESVTFGENSKLESIGNNAFGNCESLISIIIPDSITWIGDGAFCDCHSLTSVTFGENSKLESIGASAFYGCGSLTNIVIPDNVTSIGSGAFYYCSGLTIYTEWVSKPNGWDSDWNYSNCPVAWGYTGEEYTYNFETNGAESLESISSTVLITLPTPVREGYHFMGWYDNAEFVGNPVNSPYYSSTLHTLYAKWLTEEEYLALFDGTSFEKAYVITDGETLDAVIDTAGEYVYFVFTATENKTYTFQSNGDFDTYGYLYDESQSEITYNDDEGDGHNFSISHSMSAGDVVYLKVKMYSDSITGNFTVSVS